MKKIALSHTAEASPELLKKLKGRVIVLTGKPPKGYQKESISNLLLMAYGVAAVEPIFTRRTQVVLFNPEQDTAKARKAQAAGLTIIPYTELFPA